MTKVNTKILNWRNGMILSAVSYLLYLVMWVLLEDSTDETLASMSLLEYVGYSQQIDPHKII